VLAAVLALTGNAAAAPPRATVLADSVGGVLFWDAGAREKLGRRLDLRVEQLTCRKLVEPGCPAYGNDAPESALATVQRLGPELGRIVIVNVGYNDPADGYAQDLDQVMRALLAADVEHVIWVTLSEREGVWAQINDQIRAAPARWPQLTVADWAHVPAAEDWFFDDAHLTYLGASAYALFLRPFLLDACGAACAPTPVFCGLAHTRKGFDPVSAAEIPCAGARPAVVSIERGDRGTWDCSSNVPAGYALECHAGEAVIRVLDRSPLRPVRRSGGVRMANWVFRVRGRTLEARDDGTGWIALGRSPFCAPVAPREVLVALRLHSMRPNGACFTPR
jgi:hypothetical protein